MNPLKLGFIPLKQVRRCSISWGMSKSPSAYPTLSVREFFKRFPDDEACLVRIFNVRHGERHVCRACGKEATFHRMTNRRAWACSNCGDHLYPTAGTIFEDNRTPLQMWFYAIYLFCASRHGVSGKELQRQLGVTYKTAWRIAKHIRVLMESAEAEVLLSGHVEIDEACVVASGAGALPERQSSWASRSVAGEWSRP